MIQRFPLIFCSSNILFNISCYSTEHLILYLIYEFFHLANQRNSFAVFDPDVHLGSYIIGRVRGRTLLITNSRILIPYIEWKLIKYSKTNLPKFTFLMKKFLKKIKYTGKYAPQSWRNASPCCVECSPSPPGLRILMFLL